MAALITNLREAYEAGEKLTKAQLQKLPKELVWQDVLFDRPKIPMEVRKKPFTLKLEQQLSVEVADALRVLSCNGDLKAVWTHPANEGKRSWLQAIICKAMGVLPGASDFWFVWQDGGGLIELKYEEPPKMGKRGKLLKPRVGKESFAQECYGYWCEQNNVHYAVCTSVGDVLKTLQDWGALKRQSIKTNLQT